MQRRNTRNKERVLNIFKNKHTLTVQELGVLLPEMDASTIYRNIERFVTDGVLREVHAHAEGAAYELTEGTHDHFVCDTCRTVLAMHVQTHLMKKILPSGALMRDGGVVVHGTCKRCMA